MGGMGSGRWNQGGKDTTNDYRALDIRRMQRDGVLAAGSSCGWNWFRNGETVASIQVRTEADRVILGYRHRSGGGDWENQNYPVRTEWTPCHFGGARVWFLCPIQGCGNRVAKLYLGAAIFACRHCYQLAYASQRENRCQSTKRRIDKIRDRLKWKPGFLNGVGFKPKGMHCRTFHRLSFEHGIEVCRLLKSMQE
ncbi:MAG: hypothetical protein DID92_2727743584 [Candidatus Nitrotoga sp. SPKER]|nr:MAG: hypothetical protein DID92_2727743584 [Candidatus Nitrotoga sp. SPKER]